MARKPRIHLPGCPQHIVQRGHNRDVCFFSEGDFLAYSYWLAEALNDTGCELHAYVLMTNHVHLLTCQRYIELNPVRAVMVGDPAQYRWISYRANALGQHDPLITPHPVYLNVAADQAKRQANYRAMFSAELKADAIADIRLALTQGQPLGNKKFMQQIEKATGRRCGPRLRGRPKKVKRGQARLNECSLQGVGQ